VSQLTGSCRICLSIRPLYSVGLDLRFNRGICSACADRMAECEHDEGMSTRIEHDANGVGYTVQRCIACGYDEIDTGP